MFLFTIIQSKETKIYLSNVRFDLFQSEQCQWEMLFNAMYDHEKKITFWVIL